MESLRGIADAARTLGFLGPGPVVDHLAHAEDLIEALGPPRERWLDLGSGAGILGMLLALRWPASTGILLDANGRRTEFAADALTRLGLVDRVQAVQGRAEQAARDPELRETRHLVVARGFGPPAVTAECAIGFLLPGGELAVSEPPDAGAGGRWPTNELADLGYGPPTTARIGTAAAARMTRVASDVERWPRRTGIPGKRPRWRVPRGTVETPD